MLLGFVLCVPCVPWCGLLIRTWACCSESGQPRPRTGQAARVRNRRPACGTRWSPSRCCMRPIRICACCRWVHDPIGWRCTPSDWVQRPLTGAAFPNGCSASRVTAALPIVQVPAGGGPPARSPHASLRLGVIDLEARPGPAAAPGHRFCPRAPISPPGTKPSQCLTGVGS